MSTNGGFQFEVSTRYVCSVDEQLFSFNDPIYIEVYIFCPPHIASRNVFIDVLRHNQLQSSDTARHVLSPIFSNMGIPIENQISLIDGLFTASMEMRVMRYFPARQLWFIPAIRMRVWDVDGLLGAEAGAVALTATELLDAEVDQMALAMTNAEADAVASAVTESMEANVSNPVRASRSSIEALEKVILDDLGSVDRCMICLDEFCVGSEVTRMPCSHVYHGDCIVQWLKESNLCPLCRHHMPNSENLKT